MTKRACILVWVVAVPFLISCHLLAYIPIAAKTWPQVRDISEIDHWDLFVSLVSSNIFYNVPDYISIAIYFKMSRFFKKRSNTVEPHPNDIEHVGREEDGVWMGDVGEVASDHSNGPSSNEPQPDEAKLVMSKLRLHIATSLLDLLCSISMAFLLGTVIGSVVGKMYFVVICFWLPLMVVKSNVSQLDGILTFSGNLIRCKVWGNDT